MPITGVGSAVMDKRELDEQQVREVEELFSDLLDEDYNAREKIPEAPKNTDDKLAAATLG
jgi:hypothetical protein